MKQVGIVGWRGMVGSVLLQRMIEENDFDDITAHFFSTSSAGAPGPVINGKSDILKDANSLSALAEMDIIITCQGGDYTKAMAGKVTGLTPLRRCGWMKKPALFSTPSTAKISIVR